VAGHEECEAVRGAEGAYGSGCPGVSGLRGKLTVRHDFAARHRAKRIGDGRVLGLIRRYLQAGIMAINVRPKQGNRSRSVEDPVVRRRIVEIVGRLVS